MLESEAKTSTDVLEALFLGPPSEGFIHQWLGEAGSKHKGVHHAQEVCFAFCLIHQKKMKAHQKLPCSPLWLWYTSNVNCYKFMCMKAI